MMRWVKAVCNLKPGKAAIKCSDYLSPDRVPLVGMQARGGYSGILMEYVVLADEFMVIDAESRLWQAVRQLLDAALRLEQQHGLNTWHGWNKAQIDIFLKSLPSPCSLVAGVWETGSARDEPPKQEQLVIGVVCEVQEGEVCSLRTFEALAEAGLKPVEQVEPGFEDAIDIMRAAKKAVAPVAWALFTDKITWDAWVFGDADYVEAANGVEGIIDKGELMASFARQGRCVLMGSQTAHVNSHHNE